MYCLDTNVLINSWYFWYTPKSHPTFWKGIEELAKQNKLGFPPQVYEELAEQKKMTSLSGVSHEKNT